MVEGLRTARTVCVLGADPAGLAAARELELFGHRAIVLEASGEVGGVWGESVEIGGRRYDPGPQRCGPQYQQVARLVADLGLAAAAAPPVHRVIGPGILRMPRPGLRRRATAAYLALRAFGFPGIGAPEMAHCPATLAEPASQWLPTHEAEVLLELAGAGYTATGHGRLDGDLPILYFIKYLEVTGLARGKPPVLGHPNGFTVVGGLQRLWERMAAELRDVRCGIDVQQIVRSTDGVTVHTSTGTVQAEDLILTAPIDQALRLLDPSEQERELAARVRYVDSHAVLCAISGLPADVAAIHISAGDAGSSLDAGSLALYRAHPDRDDFTCYLDAPKHPDHQQQDDPAVIGWTPEPSGGGGVEARLRQEVTALGGRLKTVHWQRSYHGMPHFTGQDIKDGGYGRLEALQGALHTYHAGALPGFALVESAIAHAQDLVRRFFAHRGSAGTWGGDGGGQGAGAQRPAMAVDALRGWLVDCIADLTWRPAEQIDPAAPLAGYGLHSLSAMALMAEASERIGRRVPVSLLYRTATIDSLARHLASPRTAAVHSTYFHTPSVETVSRPARGSEQSTAAALFWIGGGGSGDARYLEPLAQAVGWPGPVYLVPTAEPRQGRQPGQQPGEPPRPVPGTCVADIRRLQPHGPYLLSGHSYGGLVAYETGCRLAAEGEQVQVVALDTHLPEGGRPGSFEPDGHERRALAVLVAGHLPAVGLTRPVAVDWTRPLPQVRAQVARLIGGQGYLAIEEEIRRQVHVLEDRSRAMRGYEPSPSSFPVILLRAAGSFPAFGSGLLSDQLDVDRYAGWRLDRMSGLRVQEVPGDHFSMVRPPCAEAVAATIRRFLPATQPSALRHGPVGEVITC